MLIRFIIHGIILYGLLVASVYFLQGWLVFPRYAIRFDKLDVLGPNEDVLHLKTLDGVQLEGLISQAYQPAKGTLIIFGGNSYDTPVAVRLFSHIYKDLNIVGFNYRGYGGSEGSPSEQALLADSLLIYDEVAQKFPKSDIYALGISLGSSVATYMTSQRDIKKLMLITPFDSVVNVAKKAYPFLPVESLLKHRLETMAFIQNVKVPIAVISAEKDKVIKKAHTEALKKTIPNLVYEKEIPNAGHNDILMKQDTMDALKEALNTN